MKRTFPQLILFCLLLFLNTSTAVIYNLTNEISLMIPIRIGTAIIYGSGVTLLITLFIRYTYKFLKVKVAPFFIILFWILFVIECFLLFNFYSLITPSTILVILETNASESSEFFKSYFDTKTIILLLFILVSSGLAYRFYPRITSIKMPAFLHKKSVLLPTCLIILLSYLGLTYYVTQIRQMTSYQMLTGVERLWYSTKSTLHDRLAYKKNIQLVQNNPPILTANKSDIPYIIVILGESLSKWHMSAYGYPLPTTPNLCKRIKNDETHKYDSVYTPRTITSEAIRQIMTFYAGQNNRPWYKYHTLPSVMKEAGYYTCWLSNQDSFTAGDNNSTAGIASTSNIVEFAHTKHASEERYGYFDDELLPLLEKNISKNKPKNFICLHLMGSHRRYTNRYPSDFNRFGINDIKKRTSYKNKQTIAEYDNSVFYNDYICEEIIKLLEKKDAIIFCFPDHGEEVYDTRNMCGHTLENPSVPMKEIPFWIWTSNDFKKKHPAWEEKIQESTQKAFCTSNFIHTVMHLCGIQTINYQEEKSLFYLP